MAVSLSIAVSPAAPSAGQQVTCTYALSGNTAGGATTVTFTGTASGALSGPVSGSFAVGGAPASVTFGVPTCPGLSFSKTAAANVFTAVASAGTGSAATVSGSAVVGGVTIKATASVTLPGSTVVTPPPPVTGKSQCVFGVWDDASGYPSDGVSYSWAGVQKFSAAPVKSATYYMAWLAPYPTGLGSLAKANGASLYLNLEPWNTWGGKPNPTFADIAAGKYDSYLQQLGQAIASQANPCRVTFAHEMNGNGWYPWQQSAGVTPAQWIAAWEHVYQVIKAAAGNLAQMTWCPNNADVGPVAAYWPGPDYCDVAAADMYLNTASVSQTWATFAKQTVDQIGKLDGIGSLAGQVWNAETGVAGTNRSARITQFVSDMHHDGRVSGFAWWNESGYLLQPAELTALTAAVNAWNAG